MQPFSTRVSEDGVLIVTFDDVKMGWEQNILLTSDRHWDSKHTDRAMQKRHLDRAVAEGALIIDLGDLFDAMQGRHDRRGNKSEIREELLGADYFTRLPMVASEWFGPYAKNWLFMGTGNHETAVLRHQEVNLTWQLARLLNAEHGGSIHLGKYSGWMKFMYRFGKRSYHPTTTVRYHHGSGGNAEVTKGVIKTNRRAVYLPDADILVSGHTHQTWQVPLARERVTNQGQLFRDKQMHLSIPAYKQESLQEGYVAEKEYAPTLTGAIWWRMHCPGRGVQHEFTWIE